MPAPRLDFGRLVNSISTRGANYAPHITTRPAPTQIFNPSNIPAISQVDSFVKELTIGEFLDQV